MKKRFLATLLAFVMALTFCASSLAEKEQESYSFTSLFAPEMDVFATAGEAVKSSNRTTSAAVLYFDFIFYQQLNDIELETRALWNDCLIARSNNFVSIVYDLGDNNILLLVYDTLNAETIAGITEASMYAARKALEQENYTVYTVDGEDWTDFFQLIIGELRDN